MTRDGCAADPAHPSPSDLPGPPHLPAPGTPVTLDSLITDPTLRPDARAEKLYWRHVVRSAGCWWWTGAISTPDGYGRITFRRGHRQRSVLAHRFGLMPDDPDFDDSGAVTEHHRNEPLCVRTGPGHLAPGSQTSNLAYAVSLGRAIGPRATGGMDRAARFYAIRGYLAPGGDPTRVRELFGRPFRDQLHVF